MTVTIDVMDTALWEDKRLQCQAPWHCKKKPFSCTYAATCAWNFHDFSFREEGSPVFIYHYRHYCGVGVIWDTNMWKFMYLQGIHHIQGRIDQTSTLLPSFRFSFHRVSAHSCNSRNSTPKVSESHVHGLLSIDKTRQFLNPLLINTLWLTRAQSRVTRAFQERCWGFCPNSNFIFISKSRWMKLLCKALYFLPKRMYSGEMLV